MSKRPYQFIVYQASDASWSWRLRAPNGRTIATAHDRYATRHHAVRSARDVMTAVQARDLVCP